MSVEWRSREWVQWSLTETWAESFFIVTCLRHEKSRCCYLTPFIRNKQTPHTCQRSRRFMNYDDFKKARKYVTFVAYFNSEKKCILKRPYYYSVLSLPLTTKLTLSYNILSVWQFVILNKARGWNSLIECFKSRALTSYFFFNFKEKAFI